MLENNNTYRVLTQFFKKPTKKHQLRELSRNTKLSLPTIKNHTQKLTKKDLIKKVKEGTYPGYKAKMNKKYKLYKKLYNIRKLHETALITYLKNQLSHPNAIVLFGSAARGEDIEKSDIDLLAIAEQKELDLKEYEKELNRKINLQFMNEQELKQNKEFANNIANGIVLDGYLVIK